MYCVKVATCAIDDIVWTYYIIYACAKRVANFRVSRGLSPEGGGMGPPCPPPGSAPGIRRAAAGDMTHSAACSSSASQSSPTRRPFTETPHQPLSFPTTIWKEEGCVYRSFQPTWFASWLHYFPVVDPPPPPVHMHE